MSCEMDKLFSEVSFVVDFFAVMQECRFRFQVYSENTTPYGPTSFLVTTWRVSSSELSGYAQHDAHEFFISVLNQVHSTSRGSTNVSCNCIIHSTFAGSLQSEVKCERCGNVTTTIDPILDISLELKGKGGEMVTADNTLAGCLRRFVFFFFCGW
jgi:ubiquitin carboxyl-terminal hydrolase 22/27/51